MAESLSDTAGEAATVKSKRFARRGDDGRGLMDDCKGTKKMGKQIWPVVGSVLGALIVAGTVWWSGTETRSKVKEHNRLVAAPAVLPKISDGRLDNKWGIYLRNEGDARAEIN